MCDPSSSQIFVNMVQAPVFMYDDEFSFYIKIANILCARKSHHGGEIAVKIVVPAMGTDIEEVVKKMKFHISTLVGRGVNVRDPVYFGFNERDNWHNFFLIAINY